LDKYKLKHSDFPEQSMAEETSTPKE